MIISDYQSGVPATVGSVSQALRVSPYSDLGKPKTQKWTYCFSDSLKRLMGNSNLNTFMLIGGEGKIVRLQRLVICATMATASAYLDQGIRKYKDFGTPSLSTIASARAVPLDSIAPGPKSFFYIATAGVTLTNVPASDVWTAQPICGANQFLPLTATPANGTAKWDYDFRFKDESEAPTLRGPREALGLYYQTTSGNTPTHTIWATYTEEDA